MRARGCRGIVPDRGASRLPHGRPAVGQGAAYNRRMLDAMKALAERSVMERIVLLLNHVISAEPVAMERLKAHAGRTIRIEFEGWPALLPTLEPLAFRITPPGLVEWLEEPGPMTPDLRVAHRGAEPGDGAREDGDRRTAAVRVDGDAAFASDVNWLIENLRWDMQDDLARIVGDAPARELGKFGGAVAKALARRRGRSSTIRAPGRPRGERPAAEPRHDEAHLPARRHLMVTVFATGSTSWRSRAFGSAGSAGSSR